MINKISLQNFQGFGMPATAELKPITLIFGPNASGKSSIGRAIRLVDNSIRDRSIGQQSDFELMFESANLSLASYENVVFRHENDSLITISLSFPPSGDGFERFEGIKELEIVWTIASPGQVTGWEIVISTTPPAKGDKSSTGQLRIKLEKIDGRVKFEEISGEEVIGRLMNSLKIHRRPSTTPRLDKRSALLTNYYESSGDIAWNQLLDECSWGPNGPVPFIRSQWRNFEYPAAVPFEDSEPDARDAERIEYMNAILNYVSRSLSRHLPAVQHVPPLRDLAPRITVGQANTNFVKSRFTVKGRLPLNSSDSAVSTWLEKLTNGRYRYQQVEFQANAIGFFGTLSADIVVDTRTKTRVSFEDVGVGLSQVLPVLQALSYLEQSADTSFKIALIEQPELHLHPAMQAELADLMVNVVKANPNAQLIAETHSEAILLRTQKLIRDGVIDPTQVQILYVDQGEKGNKVTAIELSQENGFEANLPISFAGLRLLENL